MRSRATIGRQKLRLMRLISAILRCREQGLITQEEWWTMEEILNRKLVKLKDEDHATT